MLGRRIIDIFSQGASFKPTKYNELRYDGDYNSKCLVDIYDRISSDDE